MKKNISILLFSVILPFVILSDGFTKGFSNYENSGYNYKIIIPSAWKRTVTENKDSHIMLVMKDKNTSIEIEALRTEGGDIDAIIHKKTWGENGINFRLKRIIETDDITLKDKTKGKLIVFEYTANRCNYLHRSLITSHNDIVYIIDCKSPTWNFYSAEDIFTTALASFGLLESAATEEKKTEPAESVNTDDTSIDMDDDLDDDF